MNRRQWIFGLRFILPVMVFLILMSTAVLWWADISHGEMPGLGQIPDFEFTAHTGKTFGRDDMLGKVTVVSFFFTSCKSICPITQKNLAVVYERFKEYSDVQIVSISVDPETDSLPLLRQFARLMNVDDDGWVFVRAPKDSIIWLSEEGFMLPAYDLPLGHTTRFTLLDRRARIRGYFEGLDESSVAQLIDRTGRLARE